MQSIRGRHRCAIEYTQYPGRKIAPPAHTMSNGVNGSYAASGLLADAFILRLDIKRQRQLDLHQYHRAGLGYHLTHGPAT